MKISRYRSKPKKLIWNKNPIDPSWYVDDAHFNSKYNFVDLAFVRLRRRKAVVGDYHSMQHFRTRGVQDYVFTIYGWRSGNYRRGDKINEEYLAKVRAGKTNHKPTDPYRMMRKRGQ